jgi:type II secretion system protein G
MNSSHIHPTKSPAPRQSGFTLIELLVVITVIALLAGLTLAAVGGVNQKANRDKAKAEIAAICNALEQYESVNDSYPAAGAGGFVPFAETGETIRPFYIANKISINSSGLLLDPYGKAYQYSTNRSGMKNPASFDVWTTDNKGNTIGNW